MVITYNFQQVPKPILDSEWSDEYIDLIIFCVFI